jgi:hypothetical protein
MRKAICLAALMAAAAPAVAPAQGVTDAARQVVVEVREGGRLVGSTTAKLQLGRPAAIPMEGPFAMRLRIDALDGAGYAVRPHLTANGPAGWTSLRSPALTVAQGQQVKTLVERPTGPPLEIAVTVN